MAPKRTVCREGPDPIDMHVGSRLQQYRTLMGISQTQLAAAVGVKYQQLQKYESGVSRISAGRLNQFSHVLEVPVSCFFKGLPSGPKLSKTVTTDLSPDVFTRRETLELVRAYRQIDDPGVRKLLIELIKRITKTQV